MNWRSIPLALKCALILQFVELASWTTYSMADTMKQAPRFFLAQAGVRFVVDVMATVGALDLARSRTGTARIGAWIAYAGFLASLLLTFVYVVVECKDSWMQHEMIFKVLQYAYFATTVAVVVGLAIAAENVGVAIAGIVVGLICEPPMFVEGWLHEALKDSGRTTHELVRAGMQFGHFAVVVVLVGFAARGEPGAPEPQRAVWGFRTASKAMWVRVMATCGVPFLMLLALAARSEGIAKMLQFAMVAALVVSLWSMTQFAIGALAVARSRVAEMSWVPFLFSAAGSLWCAGVSLSQFAQVFRLVYGGGGGGYGRFGESGNEELLAWSVVSPILAIVAIALVVGGIAGFAGRRLQNELHGQASSKGVAFVILMFATVAIQQWVLPHATSTGSALFLLLCAVVAGLAGTVMMANLCTLAADSVERDPNLPTATLL